MKRSNASGVKRQTAPTSTNFTTSVMSTSVSTENFHQISTSEKQLIHRASFTVQSILHSLFVTMNMTNMMNMMKTKQRVDGTSSNACVSFQVSMISHRKV